MLSNQRIQRFKANLLQYFFFYFNGVEINKLSIKRKKKEGRIENQIKHYCMSNKIKNYYFFFIYFRQFSYLFNKIKFACLFNFKDNKNY